MNNPILKQLNGKTVAVTIYDNRGGAKLTIHHPPTNLVMDDTHGAAGDVIFRLERVLFAQFNDRKGWWDVTIDQP